MLATSGHLDKPGGVHADFASGSQLHEARPFLWGRGAGTLEKLIHSSSLAPSVAKEFEFVFAGSSQAVTSEVWLTTSVETNRSDRSADPPPDAIVLLPFVSTPQNVTEG